MAAKKSSKDVRAEQAAREQLKAIVERIERLEEEKATISDDIGGIYKEAKAGGFDAKALRAVIRLRKMDDEERKLSRDVLENYMHALGMDD